MLKQRKWNKEDEGTEREKVRDKLENDWEKKEEELCKADRKDRFDSAAAQFKLAPDSLWKSTDFNDSLAKAAISDRQKDWEQVHGMLKK